MVIRYVQHVRTDRRFHVTVFFWGIAANDHLHYVAESLQGMLQ